MHPPMLYLGYVGLSATFAYAAARAHHGRCEAQLGARGAAFMLVAWIALTLGITLGSWWAYYVLGWGGFWFWDPVENASLMPWLVATALLHSALATERTGAFRTWTLLLAIAAFSLSLIGTFLVRSGVLASVHAFANDPERGLVILLMLGVAIGGALGAVRLARAEARRRRGIRYGQPRDGAAAQQSSSCAAAVTVVFFGTLYPLALRCLTGEQHLRRPALFRDDVRADLRGASRAGAVRAAAWLAEGRSQTRRCARWRLRGAAALVGGLIVAGLRHPALAGGGGRLRAGVLGDRRQHHRSQQARRRAALSVNGLASALAHAGLGISLLGIAGTTVWRSEALDVLAPGRPEGRGLRRCASKA